MKQKDSLKRKMNSDLKIMYMYYVLCRFKKTMNFTGSFIKKNQSLLAL